jgi:hypothetical protein
MGARAETKPRSFRLVILLLLCIAPVREIDFWKHAQSLRAAIDSIRPAARLHFR